MPKLVFNHSYTAVLITPEQLVDRNVEEGLDAAVSLDDLKRHLAHEAASRVLDGVHGGPKRNVGN